MFFDDRLATVLRQRGDSEAGARTQYRQLLDILGNRKFAPQSDKSQSMVASAWLRMEALAKRIPANERAAMIREPGWRFRNADLAAHLSDFEPEVASAALNRAGLSAEEWSDLVPRLPVRARGFLRLRRDLPVDVEALLNRLGVYDRGLPSPRPSLDPGPDPTFASPPPFDLSEAVRIPDPPDVANDAGLPEQAVDTPLPSKDDATETGRSEISALVERIAQFRRTRENDATETEFSPRLPLEENLPGHDKRIASFGFAADAAGRIEWAETEVAPSVVGTRLVAPREIGTCADEALFERAYIRRQPISHAEVQLVGASSVAGVWIVDAQPRFTEDGNFAGYVGRFRRPPDSDGKAFGPAAREADRIRQLLHELRTPVTAIQGYAEVIQQQLFGPAPHEYRAMAASIAADAAHILSGFEELDRLARLEAGIDEFEPGETDLSALTRRIIAQLAPVLAPRLAGIDLEEAGEALIIALDPEDTEALIWRILATCGGGCASGEILDCSLDRENGMARLSCDVPAQLIDEDDIFAADAKPIAGTINAGLFGAGFALRLARAEARVAGGALIHAGDRVTLDLPLLTGADALPSQSDEGAARDRV